MVCVGFLIMILADSTTCEPALPHTAQFPQYAGAPALQTVTNSFSRALENPEDDNDPGNTSEVPQGLQGLEGSPMNELANDFPVHAGPESSMNATDNNVLALILSLQREFRQGLKTLDRGLKTGLRTLDRGLKTLDRGQKKLRREVRYASDQSELFQQALLSSSF